MRLPKYLGVFSRTARSSSDGRKQFYFVWELTETSPKIFAVQEMDPSHLPHGDAIRIQDSDFYNNFKEEPDIPIVPITKVNAALMKDLEQGAPNPRQGSAKRAPKQDNSPHGRRAKQVEAELRDNFRTALLRLKRPRQRQAALNALKELAATQKNIVPLHRHMFRDFAVELRQNTSPELALLFCHRALELSPNDDHAHFNLARVLMLLGEYDEAISHVQEAMRLNGQEAVYYKMLQRINEAKRTKAVGRRR